MQVGGEEGGVIDGKKVTSCYKLKNEESVICGGPVILGQMFSEKGGATILTRAKVN